MTNDNSTNALRERFLDYFSSNGHEIVTSSPLVPANDPTLLFTNAGMVQFKDVFLGRETRPYTRAASSQCCVRAGGKHNDLENVGYTARHHTFFEMLGNFSFGDYFKREAIAYAWGFLTKVLGLAPDRLWVTVFEQDDEAAAIWIDEMGVDPRRFSRLDEKDNFWQMGDTGPCGPCSEVFYDHGPQVSGGPPGRPEADGDRYVEIWNLVFMQYDRDAQGRLSPLPRPSVDTGMGLERLAAVMQGVHSNYDIDLFRYLVQAVVGLAGGKGADSPSARVIADHIRSCGFLIADGILPTNEGRGYVLRRIIRRAVRHGHKLGLTEPFFHRLVTPLAEVMGEAYPELVASRPRIERTVRLEEERFAETLEHGLRILEEDIAHLRGTVIPGSTVFKLYDTYGFPVDLTADIARERNLSLNMEVFEREMAAQRERARRASQFAGDYTQGLEVSERTEFLGYDQSRLNARVVALYHGSEPVSALRAGEEGVVILDRTPLYGESGGQVGDTGLLRSAQSTFQVQDTQKRGEAHLHIGLVREGVISVDDAIEAQVDEARRLAIVLNHSATHLLHAALRRVLGRHVTQKGSLVTPDRLRFDFSHPEPLSPDQLTEVERLVNEEIRNNAEACAREMPMDEARGVGAMALFGEKYGERVRVLSIGEFSTELCGGTHVGRAGDIGLFKIVSESGVAAGVRRIEAITGAAAWRWVRDDEARLKQIAQLVRSNPADVEGRVRQLLERNRGLEKELHQLKARLSQAAGVDLVDRVEQVGNIKVLAATLEGADPKVLREAVDRMKDKLGTAAVVLATVKGGRVTLVAGVTKDLTERLKAGELVNVVARQVGGKGGGRADMAQAGGNHPEALAEALEAVPGWVRERLG